MKIVHIATTLNGGAGIAAYRIHLGLLEIGIDSTFLTPDNKTGVKIELVKRKKLSFIDRILIKLGFPILQDQKYKRILQNYPSAQFEKFSLPSSDFELHLNPTIQEADIIHLHWINDFLDYTSFFRHINKPIVWTLQDMNPFLGCFHYNMDLESNPNFRYLDNLYLKTKRSAIERKKSKLEIVGISNWLTIQSKESSVFRGLPHHTISNCIDVKAWKQWRKADARKKLGLPPKTLIVSFVAEKISNKRKGFHLFLEALNQIDDKENLLIITAGKEIIDTSLNIKNFGTLSHDQLSVFFAASDLFIFPSIEEAFGNVIIEAMLSSTPVLAFPSGGALDIINHMENGIITNDFSVRELSYWITQFIDGKLNFDSEKIPNTITKRFSFNEIGIQYKHLYNEMLN